MLVRKNLADIEPESKDLYTLMQEMGCIGYEETVGCKLNAPYESLSDEELEDLQSFLNDSSADKPYRYSVKNSQDEEIKFMLEGSEEYLSEDKRHFCKSRRYVRNSPLPETNDTGEDAEKKE